MGAKTDLVDPCPSCLNNEMDNPDNWCRKMEAYMKGMTREEYEKELDLTLGADGVGK